MLKTIQNGGPFMWLLLFLAMIIVGLSIKKAIELFWKKETNIAKHEIGINAILFWGGISLAVGLFSYHWGIIIVMKEIGKAQDISPAIVASGYLISMMTINFGLFILFISAILWFVLRWRYKKLIMKYL